MIARVKTLRPVLSTERTIPSRKAFMTQPQDKFSEDLYATRDDAAPTTAAPATAPRTIPRFDPKAFLRRTFVEPPTSNEMPDADLPLFTAKPVATLATASDLIERCKKSPRSAKPTATPTARISDNSANRANPTSRTRSQLRRFLPPGNSTPPRFRRVSCTTSSKTRL